MPSRTLRYSGSERPACRMNHTGVCGVGSLARGAQEGRVVQGRVGHGGGGHAPIFAGQAASRVPGTDASA